MNRTVLAEPKPLGVVDTVTAGFDLVRRRPWTILIPVLLDMFIWLLPRLSLGELFRPAISQMFSATDVPPDAAANMQQVQDSISQFVSSLNLLGLVTAAANLTARLPSLMAPSFVTGSSVEVHSPLNALAYTLPLRSGGLAILLFLPLFLLVLAPTSVYVEWIAQGVRPLTQEPRWAWVWRSALLWLKLIGLALILGFVFVVSSFVLSLAQLLAPAGTDLGSFVAALVLVGWFWLSIYFFFAVSAMAVSGVSLLEAIRRSVIIFRVHFWASLFLIALSVFLDEGMALIWRGLTVTDVGVLLGIVANAFIGTSLLAASMVFYQDRMNAIERMVAHARATSRTTK